MKVLLTSDWQLRWSNVDKCTTLLDQLQEVCQQQQIRTVIHCGDLKDTYNPVDLRITNYAVRFCSSLAANSIKLYIVRGNHDRSSMSEGSEDWFPALQAAGATTFSTTTKHQLSNGYNLVVIPYQTDNVRFETMAKKAAKLADKKSVLLFHNEIKGCRANVKSHLPSGLPVSKLYPHKYRLCFGGHIHLYQQLDDNVWYVGSPFCQDWGEANQIKGFVVADLVTSEVEFIESKLPRFFDPTWPGFPKTRSAWKGHHVRIHVPIPDRISNVSTHVAKHKIKAAALYKGAELTIVPEFTDVASDTKAKYAGNDQENIKEYVEQTCPNTLSKPQVTALLTHYLQAAGGLKGTEAKVTLLSAYAENFLSFKKVKVSYTHKGITVVSGKNLDWHGHSNGSGKTSFLQLPVVGLFGTTLKSQANDSWVTKGAKKKAFVRLRFKTSDGKLCEIYRSRHPVKLQLTINKKDMSTGIGVRGTQAAIEQITGLSLSSVANAMYIDQGEVNALLVGSDTTRKELFSKFLALDRFYKARDLIKAKSAIVGDLVEANYQDITLCKQKLVDYKEFLYNLPTTASLQKLDARIPRVEIALAKVLRKVTTLKATLAVVNNEADALEDQVALCIKTASRLDFAYQDAQSRLTKITKVTSAKCPTCLQPVDAKLLRAEAATIRKQLQRLAKEIATAEAAVHTAKQQQQACDAKYHSTADKYRHATNSKSSLQSTLQQLTASRKKLAKSLAARKAYEASVAKYTSTLVTLQQHHTQLEQDVMYLNYALEAFSKHGLPMHLAGQLCPSLNASAKHYSEVFTQSEIQVKFSLTEDSVDVDVINIHGGEKVKDQSQGELRMAGLIVGFALREVMSPCNVMILDEPGEGLDAHNNKVFAQGLKQIADKLGPVMVTSHQPYILAELENEHHIEITKRNGVSTILETV